MGDLSQKIPQQDEKLQRLIHNLLSPEEYKHIKIECIRKDVLLLIVDSPVWMFQIRHKKNLILKTFQENCENILDIQLKVGKIS